MSSSLKPVLSASLRRHICGYGPKAASSRSATYQFVAVFAEKNSVKPRAVRKFLRKVREQEDCGRSARPRRERTQKRSKPNKPLHHERRACRCCVS